MNFDKNPKQAKRIAREQKKLRQLARKNPDRVEEGKFRAMRDWDIEFDNYYEETENADESELLRSH